MKIVHVILTGPYTLNMTYQENLLIEQNVKDGHEVVVIASCDVHQNQEIVHVPEEDRYLQEGYRLIRLPYRFHRISAFLGRKIRAVKGLRQWMESIRPDVVFHHGLQSYALNDLVKYKKKHPTTRLFVDSHEDFHNSATTWLSKNVLHKGFYRPIIRRALASIDKVFYVTYESVSFLKTLYGIEETHMEYYPLGGMILPETERVQRRQTMREALGFVDMDLVCVHTGKMNEDKRTLDLLEVFSSVKHPHLKLLIVGVFDPKIHDQAHALMSQDARITYAGWKNAKELMDYLVAADLYLQPGSQSATMQNALCLGCAAAVYPFESHRYLLGDAVSYVQSNDDLRELLQRMLVSPHVLASSKKAAYTLALNTLDYRILAKRLYEI